MQLLRRVLLHGVHLIRELVYYFGLFQTDLIELDYSLKLLWV